MDTGATIILPDGSLALMLRSMTWGDVLQSLLLGALLWIELYRLWRE